MSAVSIVFPHQLFASNPAIAIKRSIYLVEENLFFCQYKFHKQKLVFHRSSMKAYQKDLVNQGYEVIYVESGERSADVRQLIVNLSERGVDELHYCDTVDDWLERRLASQAKKYQLKLIRYESPLFLLSNKQVDVYFSSREKLHQTDFYKEQRKNFRILTDTKLQPIGGKWTFDTENRLKYPKGKIPPALHFPGRSKELDEAIRYVDLKFSDHPGEINRSFIFPSTFQESRDWLLQFLKNRFLEFGAYEDAIVFKENLLHHSLLSPLMNVGLLTADEIIKEVESFSIKHQIPINSREGFLRQILGWREFIRGVYLHKGTVQRKKNFWNFNRKIPASFWRGDTGILPVDVTIKKILKTGYCHHIERLMVIGNFMLLCEFDPDDVYRWFMELFIDAYDWVMVPNVYGMSQFADSGLMATKPYISGSNYLMKMSDYPKGDWQATWDGLFWRFLHVHRDFFLTNPRLGMLVRTFDKLEETKKQTHLTRAKHFLEKLDS
ncbi:cryptochrome/photolyase family protein [Leptospira ognonensis]|uniref:Cryptochrome/photolyase family protein n=1 Tax=Leptospira ognonensis TaxID=2484945 RepID=A0A4R9K9G8_9LEPT|nr:cryptochrome/photolyase family protein [Leptospira ognonensis]TGL62166.1 cryptochrome/photolyase family protein [Leptospira ognonensis]